MRRPFFSPLLCAAILAATLAASIAPCSRAQEAQSPSCTRRTIAVTVLDKNGEPITGLTAADFRAESRGKPVRILSLTPRARPAHIVVVFDRSGSIGGNAEFWGLGVEVVAHLYAKASRNVLLAFFFFGDAVEQRSGFGEDRPAVVNALLHLAHKPKQGKGATLLYDAILAAIQTVPAPQVGDVIYAVTDGVDTASATNRDRIQQQLLRSGLRFFAFPISDPFLHLSHSARTRRPAKRFGPEHGWQALPDTHSPQRPRR